MIQATVLPRRTDPLQQMPIQLENQGKIQKDYPQTDTLLKNVETCTLGLLIRNCYYNDIIPDKQKKIQDNRYVIKSMLATLYLA